MKRIGITGQAGFVGTHLFNLLKTKKNVTTVTFEDAYFEDTELLASFMKQCDIELLGNHNLKEARLNVEFGVKKDLIEERHRHRYEFNNEFKEKLVDNGLILSGSTPDDFLIEIIELNDHPWFLGCQFHPEFKSRPNRAHPLFVSFVKAVYDNI